MTVLVDTSVLVAAFDGAHLHHAPSQALVSGLEPNSACAGLHSFAEIFANLTRMPWGRRVGGDEAMRYMQELDQHLQWICLDHADYRAAARACAEQGLFSGAMYDSLIGQCALKANADVLYTWNTKHFMRLPDAVAKLVRTPPPVRSGLL